LDLEKTPGWKVDVKFSKSDSNLSLALKPIPARTPTSMILESASSFENLLEDSAPRELRKNRKKMIGIRKTLDTWIL
jgi:hypothetical protein